MTSIPSTSGHEHKFVEVRSVPDALKPSQHIYCNKLNKFGLAALRLRNTGNRAAFREEYGFMSRTDLYKNEDMFVVDTENTKTM